MKPFPQLGSKRDKKNMDLENTDKLKENFNPFRAHMEKIVEIKIFLKFSFHKNDIDDAFINDLEQEYACQFLDKMHYLPTKQNIAKILKFRPIELCDFHLSQEEVRNKIVKLIHIYPNYCFLMRLSEKLYNRILIMFIKKMKFKKLKKEKLKEMNYYFFKESILIT